jgi:hypothetical protein
VLAGWLIMEWAIVAGIGFFAGFVLGEGMASYSTQRLLHSLERQLASSNERLSQAVSRNQPKGD